MTHKRRFRPPNGALRHTASSHEVRYSCFTCSGTSQIEDYERGRANDSNVFHFVPGPTAHIRRGRGIRASSPRCSSRSGQGSFSPPYGSGGDRASIGSRRGQHHYRAIHFFPESAQFLLSIPPVRSVLSRFLRAQAHTPSPKPGFGSGHRPRRPHSDQRACDFWGAADPRQHGRLPRVRSHRARRRSQQRHCRPQNHRRGRVAVDRTLHGRRHHGGGTRHRHRQPLRAVQHRDNGCHLSGQPLTSHPAENLSRISPDRRLHQPRQFGRPAAECPGATGWNQHGGL